MNIHFFSWKIEQILQSINDISCNDIVEIFGACFTDEFVELIIIILLPHESQSTERRLKLIVPKMRQSPVASFVRQTQAPTESTYWEHLLRTPTDSSHWEHPLRAPTESTHFEHPLRAPTQSTYSEHLLRAPTEQESSISGGPERELFHKFFLEQNGYH